MFLTYIKYFQYRNHHLRKPDRPVSCTCVSWKRFEQFVKNGQIQERLLGFLRKVGSFSRFLTWKLLQTSFIDFLVTFSIQVAYKISIITGYVMIYNIAETFQII